MLPSPARSVLPPLAALAAILVLWEAVTRAASIKLYLLPPPSAIVATATREASLLLHAAFITACAALLGFALSGFFGILAAVVLASSRTLERAFYPYTVFLQTVPIVAIAPLLVVWFGPGLSAVTAAAFIVSVFPVIASTLSGIASVDPALRDLFRLYGAGPWATLRKLRLPFALPQIFTGLRVAAGLSVIGTVVGEFVAGFSEGAAGLGIIVLSASRQLRTDLLFAAVLLASILGLLLFGAVDIAARLTLQRWHPSERER